MYQLITSNEEYTIIDFENHCWTNSSHENGGNWHPTIIEAIKAAVQYRVTFPEDDYGTEGPLMKNFKSIKQYCAALRKHSSCIDAYYCMDIPEREFELYKSLNPELFI